MDKQRRIKTINEELEEEIRPLPSTVLGMLGLNGQIRRYASYAAETSIVLGLPREGKRRLSGYSAQFDEVGNTKLIEDYYRGEPSLRIEVLFLEGRISMIKYYGLRRRTLDSREILYSTEAEMDVVRLKEGSYTLELAYANGLVMKARSFYGDREDSQHEYAYSRAGRVSEIITRWSGGRPGDTRRYKYDERGNVLSETIRGGKVRNFGYTYDSSGNVLDLTEYTDGSPTTRTTFSYTGRRLIFAKREDRVPRVSLKNEVLSEFYDEHLNCIRRILEVAETKMSGAVVTKPIRSEFNEIDYYRL